MSNIHLLNRELQDKEFQDSINAWKSIEPVAAEYSPFPQMLNAAIVKGLQSSGIHQLYSHQLQTFEVVDCGENAIISTGTASGKTICYNLPVFNSLVSLPAATALYLFPTKALTADQLKKIHELNSAISLSGSKAISMQITPAIYDGDTPAHERNQIRNKANILLTNPDMLHIGILPHHTIWERIFRNLRFVVIDEIHIYRGVFGSHLANVIRRLKRICSFYGSKPQFIMTSATIANANEFAQKLIEEPVTLIDHDGSEYGKRNLVLYNPPIVNQELGLRNGIISESVRIAEVLFKNRVQTIFFARSRKTVEITLRNLQTAYEKNMAQMHGYRSGYLARERRLIENGLKDGSICAVVSTNALELGIDMGGVDAIIMMGYPGSIAAFRQQSGRAGRLKADSLAMLVASSSPLDQFVVNHPEYLFGKSPENALIDPDNPLILLDHIRCALFELPFLENDEFGSLQWSEIKQYLEFLLLSSEAYSRSGRFVWMKDAYPANNISLRSASANRFLLICDQGGMQKTIGEVDQESANWMVHPGAIYLHEGVSYLVENLDYEKNLAKLSISDVDYYTEPKKNVEIQKIKEIKSSSGEKYQKHQGEIIVTSQVTGYQKIKWFTYEVLAQETLDMPKSELSTVAYWLTLPKEIIEKLRQNNLWRNDANEYGAKWPEIRKKVRERDGFACQLCGMMENEREHHVHHKIPFRTFMDSQEANRMENLITLCADCHQRVEQNVRIRSGLAGLGYVISHLAPVFLMCDEKDLGTVTDPQAKWADQQPSIIIYDQFPGGIGLSASLFDHDQDCIQNAVELIKYCPCKDGCPSCVGPAGENGVGAKEPTLAILEMIRSE